LQVSDFPLKLANQLFKLPDSALKVREFCLLRPRLSRHNDEKQEKD
jgi:hypothetical protein